MHRAAIAALPATLAVALLAVLAAQGRAEGESPKTLPAAAGVLNSAVDPLDEAAQRTKFLECSGIDNELTQKEFAADQQAATGFARKFDRWENLSAFDKNKSGTIDWFEAQAYRQDLRQKVLAAFDADKDGKLAGDEQTAAAAALLAGKVKFEKPAATTRIATTAERGETPASGGPPSQEEMVKKYDKDGDGKLSNEERRAMWKEMMEKRQKDMLAKYDKNGDGTLDKDETARMNRTEGMAHMPKGMREFTLRNFDADGDGELSEAEFEKAEQLNRKFQKVAKGWEAKVFDTDGDGNVSDEERKAQMLKWAPVAMVFKAKMDKLSDADGDGEVTGQEREKFGRRMMEGMVRFLTMFEKQADADKDGKLSDTEQDTMVELFDKEAADRMKKVDANNDNKLDPEEGAKLIGDLLDEMLKE